MTKHEDDILKTIREAIRKSLREDAVASAFHHGQILYRIEDAARMLGGITTRTLYNEHAAGRIIFTRIGRRIFIHRDELESYARHLPKD